MKIFSDLVEQVHPSDVDDRSISTTEEEAGNGDALPTPPPLPHNQSNIYQNITRGNVNDSTRIHTGSNITSSSNEQAIQTLNTAPTTANQEVRNQYLQDMNLWLLQSLGKLQAKLKARGNKINNQLGRIDKENLEQ